MAAHPSTAGSSGPSRPTQDQGGPPVLRVAPARLKPSLPRSARHGRQEQRDVPLPLPGLRHDEGVRAASGDGAYLLRQHDGRSQVTGPGPFGPISWPKSSPNPRKTAPRHSTALAPPGVSMAGPTAQGTQLLVAT